MHPDVHCPRTAEAGAEQDHRHCVLRQRNSTVHSKQMSLRTLFISTKNRANLRKAVISRIDWENAAALVDSNLDQIIKEIAESIHTEIVASSDLLMSYNRVAYQKTVSAVNLAMSLQHRHWNHLVSGVKPIGLPQLSESKRAMPVGPRIMERK